MTCSGCLLIVLLFFGSIRSYTAGAQKIATLEVVIPGSQGNLEMPVFLNLEAVTLLPDSILQLVEVSGKVRCVDKGKKAETSWQNFAAPPVVTVKLNKQ